MAYLIKDISKYEPQENKLYFLDANVWLILIRPAIELKSYEKAYINFVDKIMSWQGNNAPKIVINALVISEVINAYLRSRFDIWKQNSIQMATTYSEKEEAKNFKFKKHYRNDPEYKTELDKIKDELASRKEFCTVIDNTEEENDIWRIINELGSSADFNDSFYCEMAIDKNYSIVTNDGDFIVQDIPIITKHIELLKLV